MRVTNDPLVRLLLTPSILSGSLILLGAIAIISGPVYVALSHEAVFYQLTFGNGGGFDQIRFYLILYTGSIYNVLQSRWPGRLAVLAFAIGVGIVSYFVLQIFSSLHDDTKTMRAATVKTIKDEARTRTLIRIGSATLGALYVLACFFVIPAIVQACNRFIVGRGVGLSLAGVALGLALSLLWLHVAVVLLRLFSLRPRLFGGTNEPLLYQQH